MDCHFTRMACRVFLALTSSLTVIASPPTVRLTELRTESGVSLSWQFNRSKWLSTVESRDSLSVGDWKPVPGTLWPMDGSQWTDTLARGTESQFYRIALSPPAGIPGKLLTNNLVGSYTPQILQLIFQSFGVNLSVHYGVNFYAILYETTDPDGAPIVASGALLIPNGITNAAPLLAYDHGTSLLKGDVPSRGNLETYLGMGLASGGYVAVLPDYLGLGDSPGFHPYLHAATEASATIDMLRATRQFCVTWQIPLNDQLFVSGYSQGGHAALATLRALESLGTNEFQVTARGCGSGPYDLAGVGFADLLSGRQSPNPFYFLYLLAAYEDVYGWVASLQDLLAVPYQSTLPPLLDGLHDSDAVNAALPPNSLSILNSAQQTDIRNSSQNPFRNALLENTLLNWAPRAPLRLYRCSGDLDVVPENSQSAYDAFRAHGATQVELLDPDPGANHDDCAVPTLLSMKIWFDSFKH